MLHEFLTDHRTELIARCQFKAAQRPAPKATVAQLEYGIPLFLDQLIKTLRVEQTSEPMQSRKVSGPAGGGNSGPEIPMLSEIGEAAAQHGRELSLHGYTVEQVVHDYGDLCQAITDLAFELAAPIENDEFRTLNRCLDNGIAEAVTEFTYQREVILAARQTQDLNERLGVFAHELRNQMMIGTLAINAIKAGNVGFAGATGALFDRSMIAMRILIDRSLTEVRMTAGLPIPHQIFSLANFIEEVSISAALEAKVRECRFTVSPVEWQLAVDGDRDLLCSALDNLLQNAFKYTRYKSEVSLNAYASGDRILIDVGDQCGGLPPGEVETMFVPFTQGSDDKTGLGLGLSIAKRSVEANGGVLRVRNFPDFGCVFTIDLPRHLM